MTERMTSKMWMTVGIVIASLAFGGWRFVTPGADPTEGAMVSAVDNVVDTIVTGSFTGAETSLRQQVAATGTYAGTVLQAPMRLVRADAASYCVEYERAPILQHLVGPGGTITPGAC